jgi:hypothetical protein
MSCRSTPWGAAVADRRADVGRLHDRRLYRSRAGWDDLDVLAGLDDLAKAMWATLLVLRAVATDAPAMVAMDRHRVAYADFHHRIEAISAFSRINAPRPGDQPRALGTHRTED